MTLASFKYIAFAISDFSAFLQKKKHICMFSLSTAVQISVCQCSLFLWCNKGWCLWYMVGVFSFLCPISYGINICCFCFVYIQILRDCGDIYVDWFLEVIIYFLPVSMALMSIYLLSIWQLWANQMLDVYNQKKSRHLKISILHQKEKGNIHLFDLPSLVLGSCKWRRVNLSSVIAL